MTYDRTHVIRVSSLSNAAITHNNRARHNKKNIQMYNNIRKEHALWETCRQVVNNTSPPTGNA